MGMPLRDERRHSSRVRAKPGRRQIQRERVDFRRFGNVGGMSEPYAGDFADESAFERYVLQQALPLVPRDAGSGSAVYDVAADQISWNMVVYDTLGLTVEGAVDQLGIRPLCFGAAWKIADLLIEHALSAAGLSPARGTRWTIAEKTQRARNLRGRAAPLSSDHDIWPRLLGAYAGLEETRHSLVHRTATLDSSGSITGVTRSGTPLRPISRDEQEHFCRAVLLAAERVIAGSMTNRERNRLAWNLDGVSGVTAQPKLGAVRSSDTVLKVEVVLDGTSIDWPKIIGRINQPPEQEVDVVLLLPGGKRFLVRLEDTPSAVTKLDPGKPPQWAEPADDGA